MKTIIINTKEYSEKRDVLELLARELSFPDYFGYNLSALNDCMEDICDPVEIIIVPEFDDSCPLFMTEICKVLMRVAKENDSVIIHCHLSDKEERR